MNRTDDTVNRGRRQLLALAALFFVPLGVAFFLYYGPTDWRPRGGAHQGDLLDPARPLQALALPRPDGSPAEPGLLRGKWTLLYVGDGLCDDRCRKALYLTRQTRIALNKDIDRVQRVFLVTGRCCDQSFLAAEHPDLEIALLDTRNAATVLEPFPVYDGVPVAAAGRIYLVDPLGNLVLSYSIAAPDKALLGDLRKLLRLSHIG